MINAAIADADRETMARRGQRTVRDGAKYFGIGAGCVDDHFDEGTLERCNGHELVVRAPTSCGNSCVVVVAAQHDFGELGVERVAGELEQRDQPAFEVAFTAETSDAE